jgi:hypothetical protein
VDKSSLFLTVGDFFASKFNFILASDMGKVFYQNLFVGQQLVYAVIFGAIIFTIGWILMFLNRHIVAFFTKSDKVFPLALPIQNISHSLITTPIWVGPAQCVTSLFGIVQLDNKGKCLLISTIACALLPNLFQTSAGIFAQTGALREVDYLIIIIPITSALGFWKVITYLNESTIKYKKAIISTVWITVLVSAIVIPTLSTTYYLPKIAGEDYIIDGMTWLGHIGDYHDKVAGYGYRTVPIYTNMTDSSYGLQAGRETSTFIRLLKGIYFSPDQSNVYNFLSEFGARYILYSDKTLSNFGGTKQNATIDNNSALDKIYSSNDFGIYEISISPQLEVPKRFLAENTTIMSVGTSLEIDSPTYKIVLDENSPSIERIGTPDQNMLGEGFSTDTIRTTENIQKVQVLNQFIITDLNFTHTIEGNQLTYRTVLSNASEGEDASLVVKYQFYPDSIRREYIISNDWQGSPIAPQKNIAMSSFFFTPMSDFTIDTDQGTISRHIYESQDAVIMNDNIHDLYIHNNDNGIYIRYESNAPFPMSLTYQGSTSYNMSSLSVFQSMSIKPGASLDITQFFAVGDKFSTEKAIHNHDGIVMSNYPDGITPIIFVGYRTPMTDQLDSDYIQNGYSLLKNYNIPYTEAVNPLQTSINVYAVSDNTSDNSGSTTLENRSVQISPVNLQNITGYDAKIIGVQSTGINTFDDIGTQKNNIEALISYANSQGSPLTGFMPANFNYDLDTVKVLVDKKMPFILAIPINPPNKGMFATGFRKPEIAYYNGEPTDMVIVPVSYPLSSSLIYSTDPAEIFSNWENVIDLSVYNDEMAVFLIRSDDIGNPAFSDQFADLIMYARNAGLIFTTTDKIADHFRKLQNIDYTGTINNDAATIQVTNLNNEIVRNVTFKVVMPVLKTGDYEVMNATITKKSIKGPWVWLYVTRDLGSMQSAQIMISPAEKREDMFIDLARQPIEGPISFSVKDKNGESIDNVDVNIDMKHYTADKNGVIQISLTRGFHTMTIQSPGYNTISEVIDVKGRIYLIKNILGTFTS